MHGPTRTAELLAVLCAASLAGILAIASPTHLPEAEDSSSPASSPASSREQPVSRGSRWYGWQLLVGDAITHSAFWFAGDSTAKWGLFGGQVLGAASAHLANGERDCALGSLYSRLMGPLLTAMALTAVAFSGACGMPPAGCRQDWIAPVALQLMIGLPALFDDLVLAWKSE